MIVARVPPVQQARHRLPAPRHYREVARVMPTRPRVDRLQSLPDDAAAPIAWREIGVADQDTDGIIGRVVHELRHRVPNRPLTITRRQDQHIRAAHQPRELLQHIIRVRRGRILRHFSPVGDDQRPQLVQRTAHQLDQLHRHRRMAQLNVAFAGAAVPKLTVKPVLVFAVTHMVVFHDTSSATMKLVSCCAMANDTTTDPAVAGTATLVASWRVSNPELMIVATNCVQSSSSLKNWRKTSAVTGSAIGGYFLNCGTLGMHYRLAASSANSSCAERASHPTVPLASSSLSAKKMSVRSKYAVFLRAPAAKLMACGPNVLSVSPSGLVTSEMLTVAAPGLKTTSADTQRISSSSLLGSRNPVCALLRYPTPSSVYCATGGWRYTFPLVAPPNRGVLDAWDALRSLKR